MLSRLGFPSGDGSSRYWGAVHRTLWQSEESGLRRHRATQTTSQLGLRRASWTLYRDSPRALDVADAVFTGAWRTGQGCRRFDIALLSMHNASRCLTTSRSEWLHQERWCGHVGARDSALHYARHTFNQRVMSKRVYPRHRPATVQQLGDVAGSKTQLRSAHRSVVPTKSRVLRGHEWEKETRKETGQRFSDRRRTGK